jgi:hypothetical protein
MRVLKHQGSTRHITSHLDPLPGDSERLLESLSWGQMQLVTAVARGKGRE